MILSAKLKSGAVSGFETETKGVVSFLGIPYAAPPVGELRWREPQAPTPWEGVRPCLDFGYSCPQRSMGVNPKQMAENPVKPRPLRMNEDCLTLNVWTAAEAGDRLPVMVWFHGGGLQFGTSDDIVFDGEGLCPMGVVLVTVNYRLGVFGYFGCPELEEESPRHASGNYGLLDQIFSLQWVKENIAAFGGDPDNVTIFGCSGGGRSVQGVACSPIGQKLIRHAIVHSAGGLNPLYSLPYKTLRAQGDEFIAFCGKKNVTELRGLSAEELQENYNRFGKQFNITGDGYALPVEMDECVRRGIQADIDYILSTMEEEITFPVPKELSLATYGKLAATNRGRSALFLKANPAKTEEEAQDFFRFAEAYDMKSSQLAWAQLEAEQGKKPVYLCTNIHPTPGSGHGAGHGEDQHYVFHTLRKFWNPYTEEDEAFSRTLMEYWVNFAKTGDPNGPGLAEWTPYTTESPLTMILDPGKCHMEDRASEVLDRTVKCYREYRAD